jgi:KipI family sensor histidine kinase inhibitor
LNDGAPEISRKRHQKKEKDWRKRSKIENAQTDVHLVFPERENMAAAQRQTTDRDSLYPRFLAVGDSAISIELADDISEETNARIMALDTAILLLGHPVLETVPTYRALLVHYDATTVTFADMVARMRSAMQTVTAASFSRHLWEIPVVYGGQFGMDLDAVAARHGLTPDEVVRRHTAPTYRVYMIGFVPGFTYLGGLDPLLATPRLDTPRTRTPAGSISIGGAQAAVASIEAPSGWHLLGRTPVRLFMPARDPVCILAPGDRVRFRSIPASDWQARALDAHLGAAVAQRLE